MATVALTSTPTSIADGESTTGWSGDTFALEPDIKVEGSNSVACAQTSSGNNDAIFTKASGSWDFSSGEHLRLWFNSSAVPAFADIKSNGGVQIGLSDGSNTDWFYVSGSDLYAGGWDQIVLYTLTAPDVDNSADLSAITSITWRMNATSKPRNVPANLWLDAWTYGDGYIVTGGTSGDELDWSHIAAEDKISAYGVVEEINGVFFLAGDIQIGDGATTTYFKDQGQIIVFKDLPVKSTLYRIIYAGSGCNVEMNGGVISAAGAQVFIFDCDNVNITWDMIGKQISKASTVLLNQSDNSCLQCAFSECGQISPRSIPFQDNNITGYSDTDAALLFPGVFTNFKNCNFSDITDVTNDPAAIEHYEGGAATYDNLQFSGNDNDVLNSISANVEAEYSDTNQDTDVSLNATNKKVGQTFLCLDSESPWVSHAKFFLKKTGSPTGNMYARLYATSGGDPTGSPLVSSEPIAASTVGGTYALVTFEFEDPYEISITTDYAIAIEYEDGDGSDYITVGVDDSSPSFSLGEGYLYTTSWALQTWDVCFTLYTGGLVIINATNGANPSLAKVRATGSPAGITVINNTVSHGLTGLKQNSEVTYTAKPTASDSGATGSTVAGSRNFTDTGWTTDEHKGRLLEIEEGADAGRYYIVSNTTTVLKLDTELSATASNLDYSIYAAFEVIDHEEDIGVGGTFTYQYNYSGDSYVDILIFHQDYEPIELIDVLLGSTSQTIPISQVFDVNYFNPT
jgi:hypothetical protein